VPYTLSRITIAHDGESSSRRRTVCFLVAARARNPNPGVLGWGSVGLRVGGCLDLHLELLQLLHETRSWLRTIREALLLDSGLERPNKSLQPPAG
jgi:hypothetical protein